MAAFLPPVRWRLPLALAALLLLPSWAPRHGLHAQIPTTDPLEAEEARRKEAFLKAREEMRTLPPAPRQRPAAKPTPAPVPEETPVPAAETPQPTAAPTPYPKPSAEPAAPVVIQKSGGEENTDYPPPPPPSRGFLGLFGGGPNYRYLTRSVLAEIDRAHVRGGRWKYIVVHNSGTRQGNARIFDYYHRHTRHMPNGLAYHFVIGNGTSTGDGQIEIGDRWRLQLNGGHVHSDYLNNIALGICLVGDFNRDLPTRAQYAALDELITYLRKRVGRVDRRLSIVKAHKEINPVPTDCPGNRFSYTWLHRKFD
jgi:hypothetical protein